MGTKDFNMLDKFIAWARLGKVLPYVEKNDVVLDFGCGHQVYFLTQVQGKIKKGIGVDYDAEPKKISSNIEIKHLLFKERLPFMDKTYDKAFLLATIEHVDIDKVPKLFRELYRVLKLGGKVVMTTPTPFGKVILEFMAFKLGIISKKEVGDHKKYYNKKDIDNLAKNYGFKIEIYQTFQFGANSLCVLKKF